MEFKAPYSQNRIKNTKPQCLMDHTNIYQQHIKTQQTPVLAEFDYMFKKCYKISKDFYFILQKAFLKYLKIL